MFEIELIHSREADEFEEETIRSETGYLQRANDIRSDDDFVSLINDASIPIFERIVPTQQNGEQIVPPQPIQQNEEQIIPPETRQQNDEQSKKDFLRQVSFK